jgi:hypothetical protein
MLEIIPSIGKSTAGFENQTADFKILTNNWKQVI